jgi:hypothetical protein
VADGIDAPVDTNEMALSDQGPDPLAAPPERQQLPITDDAMLLPGKPIET